jgi:hypothetical protein
MAELFFHHDATTYLFDTNLLKLYRLEGNRPVEIDNLEIKRKVRLHSAEISREKALKMAQGCRR